MSIFKKLALKSVLKDDKSGTMLARNFTTLDLIFLGIGSVIGSGVFAITGFVSARYAGSAVMISYFIAGTCGICIGLIYAELSTMIPTSGSLYSYSYVILGEIVAFVVLITMFLEIGVGASFVAAACADYLTQLFFQLNITLPNYLIQGPYEGGVIRLIAFLLILITGCVLYLGNKASKRLNVALVVIKLGTIFTFVLIASRYFDINTWTSNYMPFGMKGVLGGATMLFFAFNGYANLASTAEECKNPNKSITIAMIVTMLIAILTYSLVSFVLTGISDYKNLNSSAALVIALNQNGNSWGASIVSAGAICGMLTVILINIYAISRILYSASKDRLIFKFLAKIHPKYRTPTNAIIFVTIILSLIAGIVEPSLLAKITSFTMLLNGLIAISLVITARVTLKNIARPFKMPFLYIFSVFIEALLLYLVIYQILYEHSNQAFLVGMLLTFTVLVYFIRIFFRKNKESSLKK